MLGGRVPGVVSGRDGEGVGAYRKIVAGVSRGDLLTIDIRGHGRFTGEVGRAEVEQDRRAERVVGGGGGGDGDDRRGRVPNGDDDVVRVLQLSRIGDREGEGVASDFPREGDGVPCADRGAALGPGAGEWVVVRVGGP